MHCLPVEPCGRPAIDAVSGQNIDSLSLWDSFLTNGSSGLGCNLVVIHQGDGDPCHQEDRKISSKAQVEYCQERRRQIRAGSKKKVPVPQETNGAGACAEVIPHEAPLIGGASCLPSKCDSRLNRCQVKPEVACQPLHAFGSEPVVMTQCLVLCHLNPSFL